LPGGGRARHDRQHGRSHHPADCLGDSDPAVPAVLPYHPRRTRRGGEDRRRGPAALSRRHGRAAVAHQSRGALRYSLHLRLEPVPLAAADHQQSENDDDRHRLDTDDRPRRRPHRLGHRHGDDAARHAAAGADRAADAALVRQRAGGEREVMGEVTLRAVRKSYGATEVVHGVSCDIADGELVVIVGPSGCGKSTLLRMVAGLEEITAGEILIGGKVVNAVEPKDRDIAMVFQNYALYPHMTVRDNMAYGLKIRRLPRAEVEARVRRAAGILQIEALLDRKPRQLSGGQRQRVAMGRAIVRDPQVFLFDEPLSNLDAQLRVQMRVEIKRLQQSLGTTSIYVTHDQVEAMTLAD